MSWQSEILNGLIKCYGFGNPVLQSMGIWAERLFFEVFSYVNLPPRGLRLTNVNADGVNAQWLDFPDSRADRIVIYYHGGGYFFGSLRTHRALAANIARSCQARVLMVDYRLSPEYCFPAAIEDACTACEWLNSQNKGTMKIFLAGDSAGGGLVLATLLSMRDKGIPLPAGAICISPFTDLTISGETYVSKAKEDPWFTREYISRAARMYLNGADARNPLASPLFGDFKGLPPLLIQVGTREILLSDATRLAQLAKDAGVDVKLETWQGMSHVWHALSRYLPDAREAFRHIGSFVESL